MEVIMAGSTVLLCILTGVYVWTTHKLLQVTVKANNEYKTLSKKQLAYQAMPQLYVSFELTTNTTNLVLTNASNNPCYDLEVHVFGIYDEQEINISQFIVEHVKKEYRTECAGISPCDGSSFSVRDYAYINIFLSDKGNRIPVCFPSNPRSYQVFLQYKDRLGNIYSQTFIYLRREGKDESLMDLCLVMPTILKPSKEINLSAHIKKASKDKGLLSNCPDHIQEILIYSNCSIRSQQIDSDANIQIEERGRWFDL